MFNIAISILTMGILGAAVALVCGRTIRLVQYWRLIGNDRLVSNRWGSLLRVALAATAMGVSVSLLKTALSQISVFATIDSKWGLLVLIGTGAIAYAVALVASGGIERSEVKFLYNMALERLAGGSVK